MLVSKLCDKLNRNAIHLGVKDSIFFQDEFSFTNVANYLSKTIPYSKIALLFTENSFIDLAIPLLFNLKSANIKPISVVLEKVNRLSVDEAKGLFSISEDIRCIVVTDNALSEIGLYFATVMNVDVIFIVSDFNVKGITCDKVRIDNSNETETFNANAKRVIFFDFERIKESNLSDGIAIVGSKITALIDYKIHCIITGDEEELLSVELIENAIDELLNLDNNIDEDALIYEILYGAFNVELIKLRKVSKIHQCSSAVITALLSENKTIESPTVEYFSAKKVLDAYYSAFTATEKGKNVCDYNQVAQRIHNCLREDFKVICGDILYKTNLSFVQNGVLERLILLLKNTVIRAKEQFYCIDKLIKKYGLKKNSLARRISDSYQLSGYVGKVINGMTLIKELGF